MKKLKTKSALPWFGSDAGVAKELASMLDSCKHITIPFAGGLSILPHLKARAIVANDKHCAAINFYRCASGVYGSAQQHMLLKRCQQTLSHPSEFEMAKITLEDSEAPIIERAWSFWALCWIGRKGKGGTKHQGGMPSVRRTANGGTNASRIKSAAADLELWAIEFERCEWESVCFRELIPKIADKTGCGIYCDPPWIGAGRDYLHGFSETDHIDLPFLLGGFKQSPVVVRYGDHPAVRRRFLEADGWQVIEAESRTQANKYVGEIWITKNI